MDRSDKRNVHNGDPDIFAETNLRKRRVVLEEMETFLKRVGQKEGKKEGKGRKDNLNYLGNL